MNVIEKVSIALLVWLTPYAVYRLFVPAYEWITSKHFHHCKSEREEAIGHMLFPGWNWLVLSVWTFIMTCASVYYIFKDGPSYIKKHLGKILPYLPVAAFVVLLLALYGGM